VRRTPRSIVCSIFAAAVDRFFDQRYFDLRWGDGRYRPRLGAGGGGSGPPAALAVARYLVGQAQFSELLALPASEDRFAAQHDWISNHLADDLSLPVLATQAGMSERSFSRHYAETTGLTPARAVERLRVEGARHLLSETRLPVKRISQRCGFGSEETMRRSFVGIELLNRSAFDAGDERRNQPLRLAHLYHGNNCAMLLERGTCSRQNKNVATWATPLVAVEQRLRCHLLAARPISSAQERSFRRATGQRLAFDPTWRGSPQPPDVLTPKTIRTSASA
jgi:AraC-like DNA-binding protein